MPRSRKLIVETRLAASARTRHSRIPILPPEKPLRKQRPFHKPSYRNQARKTTNSAYATFTKIITSVNNTSDSMKARPRISAN